MPAQPFHDPALPVYHDAWRAGILTTDVLREHLIWVYSLHGFAEHAALSLEMFAATGYVTDSPDSPLPPKLTVYRAQVDGHPLGTSWTARYDCAAFYADTSRQLFPDQTFRVLTGEASRSDLLMWRRPDAELVFQPEAVRAIRPAEPSTDIPSWSAITPAEARARFRSVMDAQLRLWSLLSGRADAAELAAAVRRDYRMSCQARLVWGI